MTFEEAMAIAITVAKEGSRVSNDVPVGALILNSKLEVIATGCNQRELDADPTAHAEIVAMRKAATELGSWRLDDLTLVVTLEPCTMCAGAIVQSRIPRVVFGAWDEKAGAVGSVWDILRDPRTLNRPEVISGVLADQCAQMIQSFFQGQRKRI